MALVFLALNGDGLGHLVRTAIICRALASVGERPVIFSQGIFPLDERFRFPGKKIPTLWKASRAVCRRVSAELAMMTEISQPSVLVEDTHPNPVWVSAAVRRVLIVRPSSFGHLTMLKQRYSAMYSSFLVADSPDSPTWPYSAGETAQIRTWARWHIVGPVYRAASLEDIAEIRRKYRIDGKERVCVFSMGGGGRHLPHDQDAEVFVRIATDAAHRLRAQGPPTRLIFVKGPYFPAEVGIPPQFEVVPGEPLMPALLAASDGAFVRAGFNTPWECISAGTPFFPFIGTTVNEPVDARVNKMRSLGLLPQNIDQFWHDETWRARYRQTCRLFIAACSGEPDARLFQQLVVGRAEARASVTRVPPPPRQTRSPAQPRDWPPFTIRIDDVASPEPGLTWLLQLLSSRGLCATLELIPYLMDFDQAFLDRFDSTRTLFEVSQHGYAHVLRAAQHSDKGEFSLDRDSPSANESEEIEEGATRLRGAFPDRWCGGFSPPFDGMPRWLPEYWQGLGGAFVSRLALSRKEPYPLPVISAGIDLWDWARGCLRPRYEIAWLLARQAARGDHLGIVLYARCMWHPRSRARLVELLDCLQARGIGTVSLSKIAASPGAGRSLERRRSIAARLFGLR
jgi:hypothetical protein